MDNTALHQLLHDFSTPATVLSLNLDLLSAELEKSTNPKIHRYLERLRGGSAQLGAVITREREKLRTKEVRHDD